MGIALPQFLLDIDGASGGILLLWIVGVCILLPLVIAVVYLSRSSKYTGNYVMHQTLSAYYFYMKPSLAPRYMCKYHFWLVLTVGTASNSIADFLESVFLYIIFCNLFRILYVHFHVYVVVFTSINFYLLIKVIFF